MQGDRKAKFTRQMKKAGWTDDVIALALKSATFTNEVGPDLRYIELPDTLAGLMGIPHVPEATAVLLAVNGIDLGDSAKLVAKERHDAALKKTKQSRGAIKLGEDRGRDARKNEDIIAAITFQLYRENIGAKRDEILDMLEERIGKIDGMSYTRGTLSNKMPRRDPK